MDEKLELLRRVPLFEGLGDRELEEVARLATQMDVAGERVLMRQGEPGSEFFLIVSGSARVERDGRLINRLAAGDFAGEIALVDGGPRTATVTTDGAARLLVVAHRDFNTLMTRFPTVESAVLHVLAERIRRLEPDTA